MALSRHGALTAAAAGAACCALTAPLAERARAAAAVVGPPAWSAPRVLANCADAAAPQIVFPSEGPATPTGPGAIAWAGAPAGCAAVPASGQRVWGISVAALAAGGVARASGVAASGFTAPVELAGVGASSADVVLVADASAARGAGAASTVLEGPAREPARWRSTPLASTAAPAIARGYLGDVAVASARSDGALAVSVRRYYRPDFAEPQVIAIAPGPVTSLTATMDYRSDVLLAWQQHGSIYVHLLRASGRQEPTQLVGRSEPHPQLQALVSDNDHGMVAWASTERPRAAAVPTTRVYVSLSAAGVRFGRPRELVSFADPLRAGAARGSLALRRLSTENVMLAWTSVERGHYVVRAAPAVFAVAGRTTLLSDPAGQAVLADLAPGPAGEAIALWRGAPGEATGTLDASNELWAARTAIRPHAHVVLDPPAMIAPAGAHREAVAAVDPGSDRPVAAWVTAAESQRVEYAVGDGASGYRPRAPVALAAPAAPGTSWRRIALAVAGVAAVGALLALAGTRRRARRARRARLR